MTILITGGAGYIGSHTARLLTELGRDVVVLDTLERGYRDALNDIDLVVGDIADQRTVGKVCRKYRVESVIHFAAYKAVGESMTEPLRYYQNNVAASISLVESLLENEVTRIVFSSSAAVYGTPDTAPVNEDAPVRPESVYAQTKADVERFLGASDAAGLRSVCLRYFNAAGAAEDGSIGEDHDPETHLIPLAIGAAQGNRPALQVFGTDYPTPDGTCQRDYVHVDDLSRAHIAVFAHLAQPGATHFYNLGTGTPTSVREVIQAVERVTGLKVPVKFGERRAGDPPALYANSTKVQAELGWKPKFMFIEPIVATAWRWHSRRPNGYGDR